MLFDAHVHIEDRKLVKLQELKKIGCIANAASLEEYMFLRDLQKENPNLYISAGIHPWDVEKQDMSKMQSVLEDTSIVGEIGLDNVWCEVDEQLQKEIFDKQLLFAYKHQKPVILHIKGKEKIAYEMIKKYKNRYLVHWYSCYEYLEEFIRLGCWFTIGPSIAYDSSVYETAKKVPIDRILIETDGLSACAWCEKREVLLDEYPLILERSMKQIAEIRKISVASLEHIMEKNLYTFIGGEEKSF